ncbi:hypothetical protein HMPREF0239_02858, partial [Clostridium sp. ATCC BAA-442]
PAQAPPARVSAASKDRPRPAAQPKTPPVGPRTVSYGGPQGGTPWEEPPARRQRSPLKLLVLVLVSLFLLCIVLPFVLGLMLNLSEAFAGRRPEPGAVAQAEPAGGTHALWEPFSIHGTQQVTVEDPWEVDLTYVPLARREGFRCLAVDLWVEGGERRDDLTFFPAELRLEDGTALLAEDDASLARQLKDAGVYLVTLSDAQWEDPLYGQMIFFVPEDASGGAVLALYEGEPDSSTPSAVHQIPLELPWGAVGTV